MSNPWQDSRKMLNDETLSGVSEKNLRAIAAFQDTCIRSLKMAITIALRDGNTLYPHDKTYLENCLENVGYVQQIIEKDLLK